MAHTTIDEAFAAPVADTCTYDSGSMTDCIPLCSKTPTQRLVYLVPCYGYFPADLCGGHVSPMQGRIYPDRHEVRPLQRG